MVICDCPIKKVDDRRTENMIEINNWKFVTYFLTSPNKVV